MHPYMGCIFYAKSANFSYYYLSMGLVVVNPPFTTTWRSAIQRPCFAPYFPAFVYTVFMQKFNSIQG